MEAPTAEAAGAEAAESIPEDIADDEADELEISSIRDDLDVEVWKGVHASRPTTAPDFVFE